LLEIHVSPCPEVCYISLFKFGASGFGWLQNKEVRFNAENGRKASDKYSGS
jgi:hypothetical protein